MVYSSVRCLMAIAELWAFRYTANSSSAEMLSWVKVSRVNEAKLCRRHYLETFVSRVSVGASLSFYLSKTFGLSTNSTQPTYESGMKLHAGRSRFWREVGQFTIEPSSS